MTPASMRNDDYRLPGKPEFDMPRRRAAPGGFGRRRPIDFGDEGRFMPAEEIFDDWQTGHEGASEVGKRRLADDHQQGDAVLHDGIEFVRLVADAAVVRERDLAALSDFLQPGLVGRIVGKVISVPLDRQTAGFQNLRESFAEIAIGEIDKAQAARS
jgi:hypothetical protein